MIRQKEHDDILELLREEGAEAARKAQRGLIIQPGAIGDCILTLPLAAFMKETLGLGGVDMLGHAEYIGILPGRSCIDGVSSIDSVDIHRLFADEKAFELADRDPLIGAFAGYSWIVTFLGEPESSFEHNLIYTAHCSGSAEVMTLAMKAPKGYGGHLADFYIEQFVSESGLVVEGQSSDLDQCLIKATSADTSAGQGVLKGAELDVDDRPVVIAPGAGGLKKCWHLDNFLTVAKELQSGGVKVVFLLGPAETERYSKAIIKKMEAVARCLVDLSLAEVLGLLNCAGAFIGNDSGITHLAAGLGARTIALFGPTDPSVYRPVGPAVTVIKSGGRTFSAKPSVRSQRRVIEAVLP